MGETRPSQGYAGELNKDFAIRLEGGLSPALSHRAPRSCERVFASGAKLLVALAGAARNFHLIADFDEQLGRTRRPAQMRYANGLDNGWTINLIKDSSTIIARNLGITDSPGAVDVAAVNVPLRLSVTVKKYGEQVGPRSAAQCCSRRGSEEAATESIRSPPARI